METAQTKLTENSKNTARELIKKLKAKHLASAIKEDIEWGLYGAKSILFNDKSWPSFRKNFLNNGSQEIESYSNAKPFSFKTNGLIWSTPVIDENETVYFGSTDKYFYALDSNGKLIWKYKINDTLDSLIDSAALITSSGKIIIPGGDGYIHALNKKTGKKIWTFRAYHATDEQVKTGVLVNSFEGNVVQSQNGKIYAGSDNGYMYCLNEDGKEIWSFKTDMQVWSAPVFDLKNEWMSFGSLDRYLYLLEPETGKLLDKIKIGGIKASPSYDSENNILFVGNIEGKMYAFKIVNKKFKKLWEFRAKKEIYSSTSYYANRIYFGSVDGNLYCLDEQGNLVWKYNTFSRIASSPAIIKDKMIVFGAANGKLYALNFDGTRIWSFKTSDYLHKTNLDSSPAVSKTGRIYIGSYDGNLYCIPISYCSNTKDERCEFEEKEDAPFKNGKMLRFEDRDGNVMNTQKVGLSEPIKIRLIAFENNEYLPNTAIGRVGLRVSLTPNTEFFYRVSSDGHFINIIPKDFWQPDTNYKIGIRGTYYKKTNFFIDRLKWFFLPKFNVELEFSTKGLGSSEFFESIREKEQFFGVNKISLFQPLGINTLIPAATDAQKFLARFFDKNGDRFKMQLMPAFEKNGKFYKIKDAKREMLLDGKFKGKYFLASGSLSLSAMGSTIPLKKARFSGEVDKNNIENGMFFAEANCFKIKGNTKNYAFPLSSIDDICGSDFKLIAVGRFEGKRQ